MKGTTLDLVGKKFGHLMVLQRIESKDYGTWWSCRCDCGKTIERRGKDIIRRIQFQNCGCINNRSQARLNPIPVGSRFGRLTTIAEAELLPHGKYKSSYYKCKCGCGNETKVYGSDLRNNHTKSCGCLHDELVGINSRIHGLSKTKEYICLASHKRRELKRKLDFQWTLEMDEALRKAQPRCVVCGKENNLTIDHVQALSHGYGLSPGNAVILCKNCNSRKSKKEIGSLSPEVRIKIQEAARNFLEAWERSQTRAL